MTLAGKLITAAIAALWGLFTLALPDVPKQAETVKPAVYSPATSVQIVQDASNPIPPATTTPLPNAGNCEGWVGVAYGIGWPQQALDTLRLAMQLESGCDPHAIGDHGDSIGLLQIHCPTWATPNAAWPTGWMQHYGMGDCQSLLDPITNLRVGLMIWEGWEGSTPGWHHWHALP
jgi:hypothetical protein